MNSETIAACMAVMKPGRAILLKGESGIGKSAFLRAFADRLGLPFIDIRLGQRTEGDLIGLPKITDDGVIDVPPEYILRASREPCFLLFDELNRGLPTVIQGVFQIILDRCLGTTKLHPQTRVAAAINTGHAYDVTDLDPALLRRFAQFDFQPSVDEWLAIAPRLGVHQDIRTFLTQNPDHLETAEPLPDGRIGPSRRAWTMVAEDLQDALTARDYSLVYPLCLSLVGMEAARAFRAFLDTKKKELTPQDILQAPAHTDFRSITEALTQEEKIRLQDLCVKHLVNNEATAGELAMFGRFVDTLPDELVVSTWRMVNTTPHAERIGNAIRESLARVL